MSTIIRQGVFAKFLIHFFPGKEDDCWEWFGHIMDNGYGRFMVNRILYRPHIISYAYYNKLEKVDLQVLHECDNKKCVNPNHLFLGTTQNNTQDKVNKGRQAKGEIIGTSKLTDEEVIEIRLKYKTNKYTQRRLAGEYGINQRVIWYIVNNIHWRHLLIG